MGRKRLGSSKPILTHYLTGSEGTHKSAPMTGPFSKLLFSTDIYILPTDEPPEYLVHRSHWSWTLRMGQSALQPVTREECSLVYTKGRALRLMQNLEFLQAGLELLRCYQFFFSQPWFSKGRGRQQPNLLNRNLTAPGFLSSHVHFGAHSGRISGNPWIFPASFTFVSALDQKAYALSC